MHYKLLILGCRQRINICSFLVNSKFKLLIRHETLCNHRQSNQPLKNNLYIRQMTGAWFHTYFLFLLRKGTFDFVQQIAAHRKILLPQSGARISWILDWTQINLGCLWTGNVNWQIQKPQFSLSRLEFRNFQCFHRNLCRISVQKHLLQIVACLPSSDTANDTALPLAILTTFLSFNVGITVGTRASSSMSPSPRRPYSFLPIAYVTPESPNRHDTLQNT